MSIRKNRGRFFAVLISTLSVLSVDRNGASAQERWPNGIIYFEVEGSARDHLEELYEAMDEWSAVSAVVFVPRNGRIGVADYIAVRDTTTNDSPVGKVGGRQELNIRTDSWGWAPTHELGHAIGFPHEQSRPDRDEFISVVWDNVNGGRNNGNFAIVNPNGWIIDQSDPNGGGFTGYDYFSIMHYPQCFQSLASGDGDEDDCPDDDDYYLGGATIDFPDHIQDEAGLFNGISDTDVRDVRNLYGNRTDIHLSPDGDRDGIDGCGWPVSCDLNEGTLDDPYCLDKCGCLYSDERVPTGATMWLDGRGDDPPDTTGTYGRRMTLRAYPGTTVALGR